MSTPAGEAQRKPAGFRLRLAALLVDLLALNGFQVLLVSAMVVLNTAGLPGFWPCFVAIPASFVLWMAYLALFSTQGRQTLGYRLTGLTVRPTVSREVGIARAFWRAFLVVVSLFSFGLCFLGLFDYLTVAATKSKRAIHDLLSGTRVEVVRPVPWSGLILRYCVDCSLLMILVFEIVRPFVFQAFWTPSGGMRQTLRANDRIMVNKLLYRFREPHRHDLIVFVAPAPAMGDRELLFIKRVIGLPGDRVAVVRDRAYIDGRPLSEPYAYDDPFRPNYDFPIAVDAASPAFKGTFGKAEQVEGQLYVRVPEGKLFVLGDNRDDSNDSHRWGFLPRESVEGKVLGISWPPGRICSLE